jgi:hypothetical protein
MKARRLLPASQTLVVRLHEKGGKRQEVPCRPSLEQNLNVSITAAGIARGQKGPLFCSTGKDNRAMSRFDVLHIIKRRAEAAGPLFHLLPYLWTTGITTYLQNGGTLEHAQTSPITNRPERLSYTISPARNSRSRKSRASTSKPVPNVASRLARTD